MSWIYAQVHCNNHVHYSQIVGIHTYSLVTMLKALSSMQVHSKHMCDCLKAPDELGRQNRLKVRLGKRPSKALFGPKPFVAIHKKPDKTVDVK